jgi:hypothetical protein
MISLIFLTREKYPIYNMYKKKRLLLLENDVCYDTDDIGLCGEPICVKTLSSHCKGPFK